MSDIQPYGDDQQPAGADEDPVAGELVSPGIGHGPADMLGGGGLDLGAMMQMAAQVQQQVADAQEALGSAELVGTAGGGLVSVTLNGHLHLLDVTIDPSALGEEDPTILGDLIRAAWQDAHDQVAQMQAAANPLGDLGGLGGGLGGLLGGL